MLSAPLDEIRMAKNDQIKIEADRHISIFVPFLSVNDFLTFVLNRTRRLIPSGWNAKVEINLTLLRWRDEENTVNAVGDDVSQYINWVDEEEEEEKKLIIKEC